MIPAIIECPSSSTPRSGFSYGKSCIPIQRMLSSPIYSVCSDLFQIVGSMAAEALPGPTCRKGNGILKRFGTAGELFFLAFDCAPSNAKLNASWPKQMAEQVTVT